MSVSAKILAGTNMENRPMVDWMTDHNKSEPRTNNRKPIKIVNTDSILSRLLANPAISCLWISCAYSHNWDCWHCSIGAPAGHFIGPCRGGTLTPLVARSGPPSIGYPPLCTDPRWQDSDEGWSAFVAYDLDNVVDWVRIHRPGLPGFLTTFRTFCHLFYILCDLQLLLCLFLNLKLFNRFILLNSSQ